MTNQKTSDILEKEATSYTMDSLIRTISRFSAIAPNIPINAVLGLLHIAKNSEAGSFSPKDLAESLGLTPTAISRIISYWSSPFEPDHIKDTRFIKITLDESDRRKRNIKLTT